MHHTHRAHYSPGPPSPPSQQNKVMLQREYREKEGECFITLRDVIKDLTGKELRTRQEILREAIDILLTASEIRKQSETRADALTPYGTSPPTNPEDTTSGYFQSLHWLQSWQSSAEFDGAFPYHGVHFDDQLYHFMSTMDSAFNQANSLGYGEDWSDYPQLEKTF